MNTSTRALRPARFIVSVCGLLVCLAIYTTHPSNAQTAKPQSHFAKLDAMRVHYQNYFLMMDEPQKFNDTVLAFLKKSKLIK